MRYPTGGATDREPERSRLHLLPDDVSSADGISSGDVPHGDHALYPAQCRRARDPGEPGEGLLLSSPDAGSEFSEERNAADIRKLSETMLSGVGHAAAVLHTGGTPIWGD